MALRAEDNPLDGIDHPMFQLNSPRFTRKEKVLKREVDAYLMSDVRETAKLQIGKRSHEIKNEMDLPDETCKGLTFKMKLVQVKKGSFYLLARWKPDRYMRRNTCGLSQKWFIDKEVFPPNIDRFVKRIQDKYEAQEEL